MPITKDQQPQDSCDALWIKLVSINFDGAPTRVVASSQARGLSFLVATRLQDPSKSRRLAATEFDRVTEGFGETFGAIRRDEVQPKMFA